MKTLTPHENNLKILKSVTPSMRYDKSESFTKWQSSARKKLSELIGLDKFCCVKPDLQIEYDKITGGFRDIRFSFSSEENYRVPCHLCLPESADNTTPLVICLQGHSHGMYLSLGESHDESDRDCIDGDRNFAERAIKEGCAALVIEQRCFGEAGGDSESNPDCYISSMAAILIGRTTVAERVWDVSRAIDAVTESFSQYFNIEKICCLGNSGGGTTTVYAAAIDERISFAVPSCAVAEFDYSIAAIHHCSCNFVPHIREYFNMGDILGLIAPRYLIQVSGKNDRIFPIDSAEKCFEEARLLYEACGATENCRFSVGDGGHRFYADSTWKIMHKFGL